MLLNRIEISKRDWCQSTIVTAPLVTVVLGDMGSSGIEVEYHERNYKSLLLSLVS